MSIEAVNIQDISGTQTIRIPENLKIDDDKVYLKKMGNALYIMPFHDPWKTMEDSLSEFSEDYMEDRQQPSDQVRESFD